MIVRGFMIELNQLDYWYPTKMKHLKIYVQSQWRVVILWYHRFWQSPERAAYKFAQMFTVGFLKSLSPLNMIQLLVIMSAVVIRFCLFICLFVCLISTERQKKHHFFRATLTKFHLIKLNHIWTQRSFNTRYQAHLTYNTAIESISMAGHA